MQDIKDSRVPEFDLIDSIKMRKRFAYQQEVHEDLRNLLETNIWDNFEKMRKEKGNWIKKKDDIVFIGDGISKRINWHLGKIEDLYPDEEGKFRVAKLKTKTDSFLRPIKKLYPLEIENN